jgi:hypothetical protein
VDIQRADTPKRKKGGQEDSFKFKKIQKQQIDGQMKIVNFTVFCVPDQMFV